MDLAWAPLLAALSMGLEETEDAAHVSRCARVAVVAPAAAPLRPLLRPQSPLPLHAGRARGLRA